MSHRPGRFSAFCQLLQKQRENFVHHHIAQFLFSYCVIIILSDSGFVNAKMRLVISQSVFHRAALQRRYFHRGYLLLLRTEPQLFQQGVPRYHGRKPTGVPAALPHGTGGTAADRKPPTHQHHQHHGQLSQSASLFPCVQKCIWHQSTGLSCKASCTIKIALILRCTPFVFPTYKNAPFVRPNTVGQMGCCSFRGAPCFFIMIHHFPRAASGIRHQHGSGSDAAHPGIVPIFCAGMPCKLARKQCHFPAYCPILSA